MIGHNLKVAALGLMLLVSGQVQAVFPNLMPNLSRKQVAFFVALALWADLQTKGTSFDYKLSDWKNDLRELSTSFNVIEMFRKWVVGRKSSFYDKKITVKQDDLTSITLSGGKEIKSTPFGLMGLFDAYCLQLLEKFEKIITTYDKIDKYYMTLQ